MNQIVSKALHTFAFVIAASAGTYANADPVDCRKPAAGTGQVQACMAASQSVDELRQFIQRTRGIYMLYIQDFADAVRSN